MSSSRKRLLIAIGCGVLAAMFFMFYANDVRSQAASVHEQALADYGGEQVEVLIASRDIAAGETLDASNVSYQTWLADLLPAGVARDTNEVYGKTAAVALLKNEPVAVPKLGERSGQVTVPEGLCAVSIPADDIQAVGGALTPGMAIDVYAVGASTIALVAQDVLVLETSNGFGLSTAKTEKGASSLFGSPSSRASLKWVTIAVDAAMVQEILSASRDKNLCLVLPGEDVTYATPEASETAPAQGSAS